MDQVLTVAGATIPNDRVRVADLWARSGVQDVCEAAIEMEANGFAIDVPYFDAQAAVAERDMDAVRARLRDMVPPDWPETDAGADAIWTSPKQLVRLLHDEDRFALPPSPVRKKGAVRLDDGDRSTDAAALEWVAEHAAEGPGRDVVRGVLELRKVTSSLKYLRKLPQYVAPDGLVHPVCGPAGDGDDRVGALTGRFGMKNPEAQQIPRDKRKDAYHLRRGFVAPPGMLLVVRDYTALEVVVAANMANWFWGDRQLLDLTAPGVDIHAHNARNVFGRLLGWVTPSGRRLADAAPDEFKTDPELAWYRDAIKAVWYKLQYGGTPHGFATSLRGQDGEPVGLARATEIVDALYEAVPAVPRLGELTDALLRRDGGVCSVGGRFADYRYLLEQDDPRRPEKNWGFQKASRKAKNFPMQAMGAEVIGRAMVAAVRSPELRRLGALLEKQVHDELGWRVPAEGAERASAIADEIMSGAYPLENLRTAGGIGPNWEDAK